jgi:hypothetical protein
MIIKKTFNFEVAEKDEPDKMTWNEAMEKFKNNPEGWRLPTRMELLLMYEHREELGSFGKTWYWSSTTDGNLCAYYQSLYNGLQYWDYRDDDNRVRCVRDIKKEEK